VLPKQRVRKLDARGNLAIFVGIAEQSKAYKLIDVATQEVVVCRDVYFEEDAKAPIFTETYNDAANAPHVTSGEETISLDIQTKNDSDKNPTTSAPDSNDEQENSHIGVNNEHTDEIDITSTVAPTTSVAGTNNNSSSDVEMVDVDAVDANEQLSPEQQQSTTSNAVHVGHHPAPTSATEPLRRSTRISKPMKPFWISCIES